MQTLNCEQAGQWISTRIDGESLPGRTGATLDEHLAACSACRRLLASESERAARIRATLGGTAEDGERNRAAALSASILEMHRRSRNEPLAAPPIFRRTILLGAAAAAAVLVAGVAASFFFIPRPHLGEGPSGGAAIAPDLPLTLLLEEQVDDVHVVPDADGAPVRQDVERVRRFTFPVSGSGLLKLDTSAIGRGVGIEHFSTRNVRLTSWPMR